MNKIRIFPLLLMLSACADVTGHDADAAHQEAIYKNWVLSRCLSYAFSEENQKQDALNSASAYLEESEASAEDLMKSEPLIKQFLGRDYRGSILGTFNTKKCIDLYGSKELDDLHASIRK